MPEQRLWKRVAENQWSWTMGKPERIRAIRSVASIRSLAGREAEIPQLVELDLLVDAADIVDRDRSCPDRD